MRLFLESKAAVMDPYADEYMAQEDEWEREGLLDPEWEKQQRKVSKGKILTSFFLSTRSN